MTDEPNVVAFEPIAVDTDTAARLLGLSPSTVRAYMRRGDLLPRYSGRKPIFTLDELRTFVERLPDEPRTH
ncbi:helix-turn-helix domain-containing protein [Cryobacterium sp. MDB2-33-2]|uniref:helix-turn-helix domain-containing protein n=1 Tax=Cryobacterium sp. MDB2-33-2 TaxID=1259179 RepID=UPI001069300F|nr:helix-turn-helix domain-containing protein [Cryobacterium sp. MDB2-33-2]TFC08473.1 DNA-binding protein [Cryobacterium sp. MDB2-33-2]